MSAVVVVVDASVALKWVLTAPDSEKALALLAEWAESGLTLLAPSLLIYETTNALYQYLRGKLITLDRAQEALTEMLRLVESGELILDRVVAPALAARALELAHLYQLRAAYDAHYLALAEREHCEFWTADQRLWNTVKARLTWVHWLGDYRPPSDRSV